MAGSASPRPRIRCFLADRWHPAAPGNPLWDASLPLAPAGTTAPEPAPLSYGTYFDAVRRFLAADDWGALRARFPSPAEPLSAVDIYLAKHGACYHPARVVVRAGSRRRVLVVNAAVSPMGREILTRETEWLRRLEARFGLHRLPAVHACRAVTLPDGRTLPMFLGRWFEGFHEFHLTDGGRRLVVWAPRGPRPLTASQRRDLYRQEALILTGCYDLASSGRIADWSHAAGDFVVRPRGDERVDLRLITVRDYRPLLGGGPLEPGAVLPTLALFLVHLSLDLRLDRLDGVGAFALAGTEVLDGAVEGFLQALARKVSRGEWPAVLLAAAAVHLGAYGAADLSALIATLAARRPPGDPLRAMTGHRADVHARRLQAAIAAGVRRRLAHYIRR